MSRHVFHIAFTALLVVSLSQTARADSFLTSTSTHSKTAARVAPAPYSSHAYTARQVKRITRRALSTIKRTKNLAIALDVVQRVDSVAMSHPQIGKTFRLGLAKLARTGDPKYSLLRGMNLVLNNPNSDRGVAYVRKAAKKLSNNSAAQLLTALTVAQRDAFGSKFGNRWDKQTPLKREAAKHLNKAQTLERTTAHPRPLVRKGINEAKEYMGYYDGFRNLLK